ncbi:uncharacterized protein F5147DRAFT_721800, partial [Suillus discolor]
DKFPDIFGGSELLKTYPYLLPCSISALSISIIWLVMYICLKEPSSNVIVGFGEGCPGEVQLKPLPLRALLTSKGFNSVLPVFYAIPIELGGLSLDPPHIGVLLAASGVIHGTFQLLSYVLLYRFLVILVYGKIPNNIIMNDHVHYDPV